MSDYLAARPSRPKPRKRIWPYLTGLVVVLAWSILTLPAFIQGIAPYATEGGMSSGRVYFYFATHGFIQAIVVWLLVSAPFIKWQGPHPAYFFILLLAAIAPDVVVLHKAQARAELYHYDDRLSQNGLTEAKAAALSTIRLGPQPDAKADVQARAAGATGQVAGAWQGLLNAIAGDERGYDTQLAAMGGAQLVAPPQLTSAGAVAQARARIVQARRLTDAYQARTTTRFTAYQAAVGKIGVGAGSQGRSLADKGNGLKTHIDALWDKRRAILAQDDAIIALLGRAQGSWSVRGANTIGFARKADLAVYGVHQAKLRALVNDAQVLQLEMHQYASELTDQMTPPSED